MANKNGKKVLCKVLSLMMAAALLAEGGSIGVMAAEPGNQVEGNSVFDTTEEVGSEVQEGTIETESVMTEPESGGTFETKSVLTETKEEALWSPKEFTFKVGENSTQQMTYPNMYTSNINLLKTDVSVLEEYGLSISNSINNEDSSWIYYAPTNNSLIITGTPIKSGQISTLISTYNPTDNWFSITITIPKTDAEKLAEAKPLAQSAIDEITANNDTTSAYILNTVNSGIASVEGVTATWKTKPVIIMATGSASGSIAGTIILTSGSETVEVNVNKTINQLPIILYAATINSGTGDGSYSAGTKVNIKADAPASGMRFKEWTVTNGGVVLANSKSESTSFVMPAKAVTVTATYEKIETYKVSYNANSKSSVTSVPSDTTEYMAGTTATIKGGPISKSMVFAGWNTAANGKGTSYAPGQNIKISGNVTLYAQWKSSFTDSKSMKFKVTGANTVSCIGISNKKATSIKIPDTITVGGIKYKVTKVTAGAFKNNKKIKSVTIGNNVKTLERGAFFKCSNLKKVTIGTGLVTIGNHVFCHAKKNCTITINSTKLKTVKTAMNHGTKNMTVKVPKSKLRTYKKLFEKTSKTLTVKAK